MKNGLFYELEQIGLVAADAKAMAKNYEEILGIGPWNFLNLNYHQMKSRRPSSLPEI